MSTPIAIIGAGGHAKVIIDAIRQDQSPEPQFTIAGLVDDLTDRKELCGFRVERDIKHLDVNCFIVAIGDNKVRKDKFDALMTRNYQPVSVVHPSAIISPTVKIGPGTIVMAGVVINIDTTIGGNCIINTAVSIDHDCVIAEHCHLAPGSVLAGNVSVAEGAFLGAGTKVIPRLRIGAWAIAGAGAVLIRDVADGMTVVGVPAQPI